MDAAASAATTSEGGAAATVTVTTTTGGAQLTFGAGPAAPPEARKLNVLCLHGTMGDGASMRSSCRWLEIACEDCADFYYPSGPCEVSAGHPIWAMTGGMGGPPGPTKRHWFTMHDEWDFSEAAFADAKISLNEFIDAEIGGPVDVVLGFSQGVAAATELVNSVFAKTFENAHVCDSPIAAMILFGSPEHPLPSSEAAAAVKSLHINGDSDPLTPLAGARMHASSFHADTFVEFQGGHTTHAGLNEARQFLLSLRYSDDPEQLRSRSVDTAEEVLRKRRPAVLAGASAEVKAAVAGITATMATARFWPAPLQRWVKGCLRRGRPLGAMEMIKGMVGSDKTPQTAGKSAEFKQQVADVLEASDEFWAAVEGNFPASA